VSTKIAHNSGRKKATDRQQPRKEKRGEAEHHDKYADLAMQTRFAALVEHFTSEERGRERR
jgi:hypothetical protein